MTENHNKHVGPRHVGLNLLGAAAQTVARGIPIQALAPTVKVPKALQLKDLSKVDPLPMVLNARDSNTFHLPAVYIGRGSPWGNPFRIGVDGTRDDVCEKFRRMWLERIVYGAGFEGRAILVDTVKTLRGQHLKCFCFPKRCHGLFLRDLANADDPIEYVRAEANRL